MHKSTSRDEVSMRPLTQINMVTITLGWHAIRNAHCICFWRAFLSIWLHSLKIALKMPFFILIQIKSIFHMRCGAKISQAICEPMWIAHCKPSLSIHTIWLPLFFVYPFRLPPFYFRLTLFGFLAVCNLNDVHSLNMHQNFVLLFFPLLTLKRKLQNVKTKEVFFHNAVGRWKKILCKRNALVCFFSVRRIYCWTVFFSLQKCSLSSAVKWKSPMMATRKNVEVKKIDTKKNK